MIGRNLPPAGNHIVLAPASEQPPQWPAGYRAALVNSGTAALALALLTARLKSPDIVAPEVILPGYGCPDLVAAALFAGVRPVLADIGASDPGLDLESLRRVLSDNTVAVVAVNFLGIAERLAELRTLLRQWPRVALIEDNAQWFPEPLVADALHGDAICLSFGRGKPVSLLGGGALLVRETYADIAAARAAIGSPRGDRTTALKIRLYNALSQPRLYGLIDRNPLLQLGQTVFKPLTAATELDAYRQSLLRTNIENYLTRSRAAEQWLHRDLPFAKDLPARLSTRCGRLLRYPVLCQDARERDELLGWLRSAGLGATALYRHILPEISGVADRVTAPVALNGARAFAERLLTLPVHGGVSEADVAAIADVIAAR